MILDRIGEELFIHPRFKHVIAVDKADPLAGSFPDSPQPSAGNAAVFFIDSANTGILFGIVFDYLSGIIRGTIVNNENFQVFVGLGQYRIQCTSQIALYVIGRNNN